MHHQLKALREASGCTLSELATKCNLSKSYLSQIENGRKEPSLKVLRAICGAMGYEVRVMFTNSLEVRNS